MIFSPRSRRARAVIILATALTMIASTADARAGRGGFGGFGSRGARTYQAPPPTRTAPEATAPVQRSATQPDRPTANQGVQNPAARGATAPGGFFSRRGGFLGGLLGAGLIGALLGYGFFGGLGGLASILGLLLQVALVVGLVWLAFRLFQRRSQPAYAGAGVPLNREPPSPSYYGGGLGGRSAGLPASGERDEIGIGEADYDEFERLLGAVQIAYAHEDVAALRESATPEMVSYLAQELAEDASRGVKNHVSDVRLLQGDLSEAWREGDVEYATVAMRFSLIDYTTDRATGQVVEGDPNHPTEATEVWTFMRTRGGRWLLSAIQKA
jgi:predicted lipid-binding transport protein (Tim44 family)